MADDLSLTEKRVLAQVLVLGDVQDETVYSVSEMLTESQERALESLDDKGYLEHTLFEYDG